MGFANGYRMGADAVNQGLAVYRQGKINKENKKLWAQASTDAGLSGDHRATVTGEAGPGEAAHAQEFVSGLSLADAGHAKVALAQEEAKRTTMQRENDPAGLGINLGSKQTASEVYASKYAPKMMAMLTEQGDEDKAVKLGEWAKKTTNGKALDELGQAWTMMKTDPAAAAQHVMNFYNKGMPDGMFGVATPEADGKMLVRRYTDGGKFVDEFRDDASTLVPKMIRLASGNEGLMKYIGEGQTADSAHARAIELERVKQEKGTPTETEKLHDYMKRLEMQHTAAATPEERGRIKAEMVHVQGKLDATDANETIRQLALGLSQKNADRQAQEFGLKLSDRAKLQQDERTTAAKHAANVAEGKKLSARSDISTHNATLFSVGGARATPEQAAAYADWYNSLRSGK